MLALAPDMASLAVGSNNFPTRVCQNAPDLVGWLAGGLAGGEMRRYQMKPEIKAFDPGHIHRAVAMNRDGPLPANCMCSL